MGFVDNIIGLILSFLFAGGVLFYAALITGDNSYKNTGLIFSGAGIVLFLGAALFALIYDYRTRGRA